MSLPPIMNCEELMKVAEISKDLKECDRRCRNLVTRDPEDPMVMRFSSGYSLWIDDIDDDGELIDWIFHLKDKTWFFPQVLDDFLEEFKLAFREVFNADPRDGRGRKWDWEIGKFHHK